MLRSYSLTMLLTLLLQGFPLSILICTSGNLTFQYADIVTSLRRGDLRLLKQALDKHEDQYVHMDCVLNIFQPSAVTTCFFRY
jgi:hypothetical protein